MKILPQIQLCLLLLITLLEKAQQVTSSDNQTCNDRQYLEQTLGKCCSRCEPGKHMKTECTETSDTECRPCEEGRYTSNWNYATKCMSCKSCDPPLVEKEKCSRTKKAQCGCPEGYSCIQLSGTGVCLVCKPDLIPTTVPLPTDPTEPSITPTSSENPPWIYAIIIAVVFTALVISVIFFINCKKSRIMEKLGCVAKIKKPLPESSGLEFVVSSPPTQENEKELGYPMEETDPLQSAEYAP
ncbi:tumor necrosis factor receptor superfamily member 14-like isoform X1 [Rana temporaria]|uniref:tumor necrosis factor receptor superfamily member 14-like isoform X1 n=1 Tax=Rana temporaria TaxID=8407 RepID=UPI001AAC9780|nr:tumor necrosis factor receptor superfamily member 14-like isoform X1 [Rana temporaria]